MDYREIRKALIEEVERDPVSAHNIIVDAIAEFQKRRLVDERMATMLKRIRAHAQ